MYIRKLFAQKPCVFSIEFFPPKQVLNWPKLQTTLQQVKNLHPDFVSITCSAGGSGVGGVSTCEVARYVKNQLDMEPLAHLTCTGSDRAGVESNLDQLFAAGVRDLMILRGDRNPAAEQFSDFEHASDLARFVRGHYGAFGLSGACYPEKHPEADSLLQDVENLKIKQEQGVTHLITQMFFDNLYFYRFTNLIRKQGIDLPVSAGIMPIVRRSQIDRTLALSSAHVPEQFNRLLVRWQDDPVGLYSAGIDYAIMQLRDLIQAGADGVHLYAMNNADVVQRIYEGISDLL